MSFLHPWAIYAGAAMVGIPLVVHFLTRPRPVVFPLSTLRFVRQAIQQRRARHRLRDFLVLLLRTAAVMLIALALSRPWWGERSTAAEAVSGDAVRAVVLDVSQSMGQTHNGIELFQRAKAIASENLQFRPNLSAVLILAGARATMPVSAPSTNFSLLRDEIAHSRVHPERLNVRTALERAAAAIAPSSPEDHRRRELIIVSDFQRGNWAAADFSEVPADTEIRFESVAQAESPANLAVLRTSLAERATPGRIMRLEVEVGNFSGADRNVQVSVRLGQSNYLVGGACPAGRTTVLTGDVKFNEPGWLAGEAQLVDVDDALSADNLRPMVVQVRQKPLYALITAQSASLRPSSSHYLECALAPDAAQGDEAGVRLLRLDPEQLDLETLAAADLIALDHPGKLPDGSVQLLTSLMRRGRPLLYVTGEPIDATNLRRMQDAAGRGLEMPVEFQPPAASQPRQELFLSNFSRNELPFQLFGDRVTAVAGRLRFAGGLNSRTLDQGLRSDVLAALNDGSALVVHTLSDAGQLAVLNADLEKSNLHTQYSMVLLIDGLVQRLMAGDRGRSVFRCGELLQVQLPPQSGTAAELKLFAAKQPANRPSAGSVTSTVDSEVLGTLSDETTGVVWTWQNPPQPGVFQAERDGQTMFMLAVEGPGEEESRLQSLPPEVLTKRLATGRRALYRSAVASSQRDSDDSWVALLAACVICLIGEIGVLSAFRS